MNWLHSHLKNSLMVLLGAGDISASARQNRIEKVRQLMLAEIGDFGEAQFPRVAQRVRYASDAQSLWYARGDVMKLLAATHGESIARKKIRRISAEFKGLLPRSMTTRSSSLPPHHRR